MLLTKKKKKIVIQATGRNVGGGPENNDVLGHCT